MSIRPQRSAFIVVIAPLAGGQADAPVLVRAAGGDPAADPALAVGIGALAGVGILRRLAILGGKPRAAPGLPLVGLESRKRKKSNADQHQAHKKSSARIQIEWRA